MIFGIGIDQIEVSRVKKSVQSDHFKNKIFTEAEINYSEKTAKSAEHYAARFAAKEAFLKALGTGWRGKLAFNQIEIVNNELGKPFFQLYGEAKKKIENLNINSMHLSLTHVKDFATAMVILEKK